MGDGPCVRAVMEKATERAAGLSLYMSTYQTPDDSVFRRLIRVVLFTMLLCCKVQSTMFTHSCAKRPITCLMLFNNDCFNAVKSYACISVNSLR